MALVRASKEARTRQSTDSPDALVKMFEQARENEMKVRAAHNLANSGELDRALDRMATSSKAEQFLRARVERNLSQEGKNDRRPAYREVYRIKELEYFIDYSEKDIEAVNNVLVQAHARTNFDRYGQHGLRFTRAQAQALLTFDNLEGLFGPIGVGHGKTFISLLCAALGWAKGWKRMLLLVPPEVYPQLMLRDIPQARRDLVLFGVKFIGLGNLTLKQRKQKVTSSKNGCFIMPYSLMSTKDSSFLLNAISPKLIIADEAHCLKNLRYSSRAKRVRHYMNEHDPKFVALSGTMTTKSIMDYRHLLEWCLGPGSCLPLTESLALEWAKILDSETRAHSLDMAENASTGPILKLVQWARNRVQEKDSQTDEEKAAKHKELETLRSDKRGFRMAYKLRLESTPGIVLTSDAQVGASLYFHNLKAGTPNEAVTMLMKQVEDDWITPQEEPIEFALHKFKWLNELSCGFWYCLRWPTPEEYAKNRENLSEEQAADILSHADDHLMAQRVYHSELRKWLEYNHLPGIDTPMLVGAHISRHFGKESLKVDPFVASLYMEMKDRDFNGRPNRISEPVWVDDFKILHAVEWAKEYKHGIIWYHHQAVGLKLSEYLTSAGVEHLHCPAGANEKIINSQGKLVVASITAHNTGKNLQFHTNQLIVQWPRSAEDIEQLLGRLHRMGQEADELIVHTNLTTDFDHMLVNACLLDSLYIHQTGGGMQKVVVAGWNPLPRVFPNSVLVERGLQPNGGEAMERAMKEYFGQGQETSKKELDSSSNSGTVRVWTK